MGLRRLRPLMLFPLALVTRTLCRYWWEVFGMRVVVEIVWNIPLKTEKGVPLTLPLLVARLLSMLSLRGWWRPAREGPAVGSLGASSALSCSRERRGLVGWEGSRMSPAGRGVPASPDGQTQGATSSSEMEGTTTDPVLALPPVVLPALRLSRGTMGEVSAEEEEEEEGEGCSTALVTGDMVAVMEVGEVKDSLAGSVFISREP